MPVTGAKSTRSDAHRTAEATEPPDLVFRSIKEFASLLQTDAGTTSLFFPTRRRLATGAPVTVRVRLGRRKPPMLVFGKVLWRRSGRHLQKIRAGLAVEILPTEAIKLEYLLDLAKADTDAKSRRRHERVPVDLLVTIRPLGTQEDHGGRIGDIGKGGAFVYTTLPVKNGDQLVLEIAPPGAEVPMAFTARVAWTAGSGDTAGFGIQWRARDAGGGRRIRELVRRFIAGSRKPPNGR